MLFDYRTLQKDDFKNNLYRDMSSPVKKNSMSPQLPLRNEKINAVIQMSKSQKMQLMYQQMPSPDTVYWPKWDSLDVYKFDFLRNEWNISPEL